MCIVTVKLAANRTRKIPRTINIFQRSFMGWISFCPITLEDARNNTAPQRAMPVGARPNRGTWDFASKAPNHYSQWWLDRRHRPRHHPRQNKEEKCRPRSGDISEAFRQKGRWVRTTEIPASGH